VHNEYLKYAYVLLHFQVASTATPAVAASSAPSQEPNAHEIQSSFAEKVNAAIRGQPVTVTAASEPVKASFIVPEESAPAATAPPTAAAPAPEPEQAKPEQEEAPAAEASDDSKCLLRLS
jgi:antitoxin (DNA-binding transcriptional repressor) of toxin-antitoxin stability system